MAPSSGPSLSQPLSSSQTHTQPTAISLESAIKQSRRIWIRDLRALHEHAKDRFGDVKWLDVEKERERERERGGKENGNGSGSELGVGLGLDLDSRPAVALGRLDEDVIYAHKAVLYARAPKSFKDQYFNPSSSLSSSLSLLSPPNRALTSSPSFLDPPLTSADHPRRQPSPLLIQDRIQHNGFDDSLSGSPVMGNSSTRRNRAASGATSSSSYTIAQPNPNQTINESSNRQQTNSTSILSLDHKGTSEIVKAHLEWIYTSEGMGGDVVEWMHDEEGELSGGADESSGKEGEGLIGLGMKLGEGLGLGLRKQEEKGLRRRSKLGDENERHEKLAQDLVYMWRSKLYADIRIRLQVGPNQHSNSKPSGSANSTTLAPPSSFRPGKTPHNRSSKASDGRQSIATNYVDVSDGEGGEDQHERTGSALGDRNGNGNIMAFTAHRFLLCSRSPYFAQVLLNSGAFAWDPAASSLSLDKNNLPEILLPTPPFTPIALHFVLGYLYSGSLDFSHRTFNLDTAFAVYRAAIFLEIDSLLMEVEARIIWDFCDGMISSASDNASRATSISGSGDLKRRKVAKRIARTWRFALMPDVGALSLGNRAAAYIIRFWGDCLGKEVAMADAQPRERILEQIREGIRKDTVVDGYGSLMIARQQMAGMGEDTTRAGTGSWEGILTDMLNSISDHLQTCLVMDFSHIADQADFLALLDPMFFRSEILEVLLKSLSDGTSRPDLCDKGPEVYQALVGSLLTGTKPDSDELILQPGSRYRVVVESTKEAVLSNIKRRWMQIKTARAFNSLDFWALKEISDEIEIDVQDLLEPERKSRISSRSLASIASHVQIKSPAPTLGPNPPATHTNTIARTRSPAPGPNAASLAAAARVRAASNASRLTASNASTSTSRAVLPRTSAVPPLPSGQAFPRSSLGPAIASGSAAGPPRSTSTANGAFSSAATARTPNRDDAASVRSIATARSRQASNVPGSQASPKGPVTRPSTSSAPRTPTLSGASSGRASGTAASMTTNPVPSARTRDISGSASSSSARAAIAPTAKVAPSPVPGRITNEGSSASSPGVFSTIRKGKQPVRPLVIETATSRARVALMQKQKSETGEETDTKSLRSASVRSGLTNRLTPSIGGTGARPKTPIAGPSSPSATTPRPPLPATFMTPSGSRSSRLLAKESSVSSLKTLRLKPTPKPISGTVGSTARQRTISEGRPRVMPQTGPSGAFIPKIPAHAKALVKADPRPSPRRDTDANQKVSKEASTSTDGDASEAITPVTSDNEGRPSPRIMTASSVESEGSFGQPPPLDELLRRQPSKYSMNRQLGLGRPSLPLPSEMVHPSDSSSLRMRASSAASASSTASRSHPAHAFDPPSRSMALDSPLIKISDDTVPPEANSGVGLSVGIPCIVSLVERKARFKALCRYIGRVHDRSGPWVGVEIAGYMGAKYNLQGLGDGSIDGIRYFEIADRTVSPSPGDINARRGSETVRPPSRRTVGRKSSMPTSALGSRGHRSYPDGEPMSASLTEPSEYGGSAISRSNSPFSGGGGDHAHSDNWIQGAFGPARGRSCALFVQPSEVVFVVGAGE